MRSTSAQRFMSSTEPTTTSRAASSIPLVTVGIPVYEHAAYVGACLRSIAEQDHPRIELVVIDDGSTDDSAQIVEQFIGDHADRFERVDFHSRPNRGLLATLTEIVDRSTGDILVPIASDDALCLGSVSRRVELLEQRPEMLAVLSDCHVIDENGERRAESGIRDIHGGRPDALCSERTLAVSLMLRWCIPGPCIALRREAFDPTIGVGPYSDLCFPEDFDLYLRLASRGSAWFVPEQLALYRMHSGNISQTRPELMQSGNREALVRLSPRLSPVQRAVASTIVVATGDTRVRRQLARVALRVARGVWLPLAGSLGRRAADTAERTPP